METTDRPPPYAFTNGHPSSPPMTPGTQSNSRFLPLSNHTTPAYKRIARLAQSPPMEFIEPIGQGPKFHFTRPQSRPTSRPSTASGRACATTPQDSTDGESSDEDSEYEELISPPRLVDEADVSFVITEVDSDESGYDSDVEVIRPDHFEDARSVGSARLDKDGFIYNFKELQCTEGSSDDEEERQQRIYRRKKKRWSAGIFKRSHSQSVEGDSSYSDNDPLDDIDSTARRLRRRVRGPGDRASLVFEDRGFSNANHIVEVEEPEEFGGVVHSMGPPSIPSDDAFTLDELPFWDVDEDSMDDIDYDST